MKILPMFLFLIAIQFSLILFVDNVNYNGCDPNAFNSTNCSIQGGFLDSNMTNETFGGNDLWSLIFNPFEGGNTRLIIYILSIMGMIGALIFIPFVNRSDVSIWAGPAAVIMVAGIPTIVSLYQFINNQVSALACPVTDAFCLPAQFLAAIIAGVLLFAWIASILEWWSGRPLS